MEGITFGFPWETELMTFIQSFASPFQTGLMSAVSLLGEEMLMIVIVAYLYLCVDKNAGRRIAVGLFVSLLAGSFIKNVVMRRRPYFDNPGIQCLRAPRGRGDVMDIVAQGYSFPSMHATETVVLFGSLGLWFKKRWFQVLCVILILVSGYSRVYLGVHFPTDVLVGWLLGLVVFVIIDYVISRCHNWLWIFAGCAIMFVPGWFLCRTNDFFSIYGLMCGLLLAFHFDQSKVNFTNIPNSWRSLVRVICAMALFLAVSKGLKLPFGKEFLASNGFAAHLVCAARYTIASFVALGIFPMVFKHTDRFFTRH